MSVTVEQLESRIRDMMSVFVGSHGKDIFATHEAYEEFWAEIRGLQREIELVKSEEALNTKVRQ